MTIHSCPSSGMCSTDSPMEIRCASRSASTIAVSLGRWGRALVLRLELLAVGHVDFFVVATVEVVHRLWFDTPERVAVRRNKARALEDLADLEQRPLGLLYLPVHVVGDLFLLLVRHIPTSLGSLADVLAGLPVAGAPLARSTSSLKQVVEPVREPSRSTIASRFEEIISLIYPCQGC